MSWKSNVHVCLWVHAHYRTKSFFHQLVSYSYPENVMVCIGLYIGAPKWEKERESNQIYCVLYSTHIRWWFLSSTARSIRPLLRFSCVNKNEQYMNQLSSNANKYYRINKKFLFIRSRNKFITVVNKSTFYRFCIVLRSLLFWITKASGFFINKLVFFFCWLFLLLNFKAKVVNGIVCFCVCVRVYNLARDCVSGV